MATGTSGSESAAFVMLVCGGLLAGVLLLARTPVPRLRVGTAGRAATPSVRVSIVVPARDEAETLPRLLGSLLALDDRPHEVIVVDDTSTDTTATVAAAHGATVVDAGALPTGWVGKSWACQVGADHAIGTHLLFLDADTWLAPDALGRLLAEHEAHPGLVSVQPYHTVERAYEQLSAYCNLVSMLGTGAYAVRPPRRARAAYGPCLLTSRDDYRRVGGHRAVRGEVLEDVYLAHRYVDADLPVTCLAGGELVRFRMYPGGLRQLVDGWTKNMASGAAATNRLAVVATIAWVSAHVAVAMQTATGSLEWARGRGTVPVIAVAAWVAVAVEVRWMLRRIGSFRWWTAAAFPIPLVSFLAVFTRSCAMTWVRRQVTWRGRRISVSSGA